MGFIAITGSFGLGYIYAQMPLNMFTQGYGNGPLAITHVDKSLHVLSNMDNKRKYRWAISYILHQGVKENGERLDQLDWLLLGSHFSQTMEEELSYQAYMMAHYQDHGNIEANTHLKFSTYKDETNKK
jgi:hypothetical protein